MNYIKIVEIDSDQNCDGYFYIKLSINKVEFKLDSLNFRTNKERDKQLKLMRDKTKRVAKSLKIKPIEELHGKQI